MSKEEVERMKKEAEAHAAEDKKKQETIEAKNIADNLVYQTEKTLKEMGDKVSGDNKKDIEGKLEDLKKVKDGDNLEEIKQKTGDLSQAIQKIGAEMYKNTQQQNPNQQNPEEGEFKEKK
jgi:molecular chaperone DnaK